VGAGSLPGFQGNRPRVDPGVAPAGPPPRSRGNHKPRRPPLSLARSLVTPEGVDLGVTLASAGSRAAAFLLDAVLLMVVAVVGTIIIVFGASGLGPRALEPLFIGWLVMLFFLRNVYFIAFEAGRRAATFGKRIVGIRVVSRDGSGLSIDQVIARNLMREIEVLLPLSMLMSGGGLGVVDTATTLFGLAWSLLFAFFLLFNRDRMRIGDMLAGTWVVEAPRRTLAENLSGRRASLPRAFKFSKAQLDAYGIAELHKLEEVLRGDHAAALATVAETIQKKIGWRDRSVEPRTFLIAYYDDLKAHLERKLLLGNRRANKHSK
jgi:uncharacterized RDD family membrane protein YckC